MSALVCLQGGNEFSPACRVMDAVLVEGLDGPVVVTALAGEIGNDYRRATDNGVRHFRGLTDLDVIAAPDVRSDPEQAMAALREARLIVLPGGSPGRLLAALTSTPVGPALTELLAAGGRVMGSSAGAMVLGPWTVLPGLHPALAPALGVTPFVVVPHWKGDRRPWLRAIDKGAPPSVPVLGIPEESGVVLQAGVMTAVGQGPTWLVRQERELPVGEAATFSERGDVG